MAFDLIPRAGERQSVFGKTGSGKTTFSIWMLRRIEEAPAIIYDVKIEPKFLQLPNSIAVETPRQINEAVEAGEHDYIVARPSISYLHDPVALDNDFLLNHYINLQGLPAYIDEAFPFHRNSQAGPGLTSLMTRGRSKGITTVISSQRPSGLSRFAITEVDKTVIYRLQDKKDRQRLDDLITDFSGLAIPPKHHFYFQHLGDMEEPVLFKPVSLDGIKDAGYVDDTDDANSVPISRLTRLWI